MSRTRLGKILQIFAIILLLSTALPFIYIAVKNFHMTESGQMVAVETKVGWPFWPLMAIGFVMFVIGGSLKRKVG